MILLRHGQSEFNLHFTATRRDPGIKDPRLTPLGHQQAEAAAEALAGEGVTRIIVSPYSRALQTAAPLARRLGLPVLVNPTVRERYAFTCDIGSPLTALKAEWPEVQFLNVPEIWWPEQEEPADGVIARAALFRGEMAALPDWDRTVVVSHWGFILSMTGQSVANGTWLRCDPTEPAPAEVIWRHH
jgi:glucosyl-3-phosphoglycerate phosphatase